MGEAQLEAGKVVAALAFAEEIVDVGVRHPHTGIDLAFAHALQQDLVAQIVAEAVEVDALGRQTAVQCVERELVLGRDGLFGLRDGGFVHRDTELAGLLGLRTFVDDLLKHLAHQHVARRHGGALLRDLLLHTQQPLAHLVVGHGLGVHQRDDEVRRSLLAGCGGGEIAARQPHFVREPQALRMDRAGAQQGRAQQPDERAREEVEAISHIVGTGWAG